MKTHHEQIRDLVNLALLRSDFTLVYRLLAEKPGAVVIDIGTNTGGYVQTWLDHGASEVHAFEPVPQWFAKLKEAHGKNPKVILNQLGVAAIDNYVTGAQILNAHTLAPAATTKLEVALEDTGPFDFDCTSIDLYARKMSLARVDFIKLDVDGYEPKALRGMFRVLKKFQPPIMMELSGLPRALGESCETMVDWIYNTADYRLCTMSGHVCEEPLLIMEAYPWRTSFDMVAVHASRVGRDWPRVG